MHCILLWPVVVRGHVAICGKLLGAVLAPALPCCWQSYLGLESSWPFMAYLQQRGLERWEGRETCGTYQGRRGCDLSPQKRDLGMMEARLWLVAQGVA